jgi:SAM-dependent methyltransferase
METYSSVPISPTTGEFDAYDQKVFPYVIRARQRELILTELRPRQQTRVLDFACGGGWLSKVLVDEGYDVVGIDISKSLIDVARRVVPKADFVVCDAIALPFANSSFGTTISMGALHHIALDRAVSEIRRVLEESGILLAMEPNLLNPLSALGRKTFPMETHTRDEKPLTSALLRISLGRRGFAIKHERFLFFFSFPIARAMRLLGTPVKSNFQLRFLSTTERVLERIPFLNRLNSTVYVVAE